MKNLNDDLFGDVLVEVETEVETPKKAKIELPEIIVAYQVRRVGVKGFENIIDTFNSDLFNGIFPIIKAEKKANAMKRIFPKDEYVVFAIGHDKKEVQCYKAK